MPGAVLQPLVDRPALVLAPSEGGGRRCLLIADLHLGLGETEDRRGVPAPTSARELVGDLLEAARAAGARRVLVAGDVKHPIVGTPRALRPVVFDFFSTLLAEGLSVSVVPGNHDVGLAPHLPREVDVAPASGLPLEGVGIFHGHRWPSPTVLAQPRLVVGHLHPGVRLAPSPERPTGKERCWVRVRVRPAPQGRSRGALRRAVTRAQEVVVLPAFNPLAGTEALNRERPRRGRSFLYRRFLSLGPARAYLLDGTDVGVLPTPRIAPRSGGARGASAGR